ncbi:DUF4861 domain-containing protein [Chryseobacterium oryctis]|uniref:DUF4861 domain-containing protein n=1 Tax=Chryseobacterium oryctis TaxID=2952618 RepID=A0ABT3HJY4_9FLAO|nr:DUF4861 domain-containing protein [Chryseobacterium oryctis]MCW3160013.1 DUF4861 domain-containing protein [Chryseobacterium oryctis]
MFKSKVFLLGFVGVIDCFCNISSTKAQNTIEIENKLDFPRSEIVSIPVSDLKFYLKKNKESDLRIKDDNNKLLTLQWVDYDADGKNDELLFQVNIEAKKTNIYKIITDNKNPVPDTSVKAYSKLISENLDDYAWENDKVLFRIFGPKGQKEAEEKKKTGILSSGIEIGFKKNEQPIITQWYQEYIKNPTALLKNPKEEGFGLYEVGGSRGVGGTGVLVNNKLQVSKNFITSKAIAEGSLRTIFEVTYFPWGDYKVGEKKRISLDVGSNFSKIESTFESHSPAPNFTVGIALHNNEGLAKLNDRSGYYLHWEKLDDNFVGEGLVLNPNIVQKSFSNRTENPDESNLLVVTIPQNKLTYYAGFAWQKSGQIQTMDDWEKMLQKQAKIIANPLVAVFKSIK